MLPIKRKGVIETSTSPKERAPRNYTKSVSITAATHERLGRIKQVTGMTIQEILELALIQYEDAFIKKALEFYEDKG